MMAARDDGHFDIEAELVDIGITAFPRAHGEIKKAGLHHMKVRVTVSEEMEIIEAEAVTLSGLS